MRFVLGTVLTLLFLQPISAHAQTGSLQSGDRIRVEFSRGAQTQSYTVLEVRGDTISARAEATGREVAIATPGLHRLQVYRGERSRSGTFLRRAAVGAAVGAVILGAFVAATDDDDFFGESPAAKFGVGAIGGAAVGGAVGAIAGLAGGAGGRGIWVDVPLR